MSTPRVSVLTPAYNSEQTLPATVASVLGQTMGDLELIVVDDGSRVPVREVLQDVRDPRVVIIEHDGNRGLSAARNSALARAGAPLVSQLDSDDRWEPTYLSEVLPLFRRVTVGLVYTDAFVTDGENRGHYLPEAGPHPVHGVSGLLPTCFIPNPTVTMRRSAVIGAGGYDRRLWSTQDWHLYLKLAYRGWLFDYVNLPLATYARANGPDSMTFHKRRVQRDIVRMWTIFAVEHPSTIPSHLSVLPVLARGIRRRLACG